MLLCCCGSCVTCEEVWKEMRNSFSGDEDQSMDIRMDIALLKEQYNSIRDKQRRETQVLCFRKEVNNEEIRSKAPVPQIKQARLSDASVLETQFNSTEDCDFLWCKHLESYRMTHACNSTEHAKHTPDLSDVTDEDSSTEQDSCDINHSLSSSPAPLCRQMSFGSYRSCPTPAGSQHYPFPHIKCLKKSETARRLGLYASI